MAIIRNISDSSNDNYNDSNMSSNSFSDASEERISKESSADSRPDEVTTEQLTNLNPELGEVFFDVTTKENKFWNGTGWISSDGSRGKSGYSRTTGFVDSSVNYTVDDVNNELYKVFSFNEAKHLANDNPYWSTPTPSGTTGIGLFQGANLPDGVTSLMDYSYVFNDNYPSDGSTGFEGSTGRIKLNELKYGDQLRVRFDFNVIPQIANTTVEPALWYANRNDNDEITFTFPLTAQPIFYGGGTVGNSYLNRVEISAWITSNEDVNALTLPAIKSDNPIIVEPIGILITVIR